jgi:hypothetical protein
MIPVGYMAKRVSKKLANYQIPAVVDVYSVSSCVSDDFADYIQFWKHNGFWLFDSPHIIREIAKENSIDLTRTSLFYYEAYELEFDGREWRSFYSEPSIEVNIYLPPQKRLEGFDVVTFFAGNSPECSPLSCNGLAIAIVYSIPLKLQSPIWNRTNLQAANTGRIESSRFTQSSGPDA